MVVEQRRRAKALSTLVFTVALIVPTFAFQSPPETKCKGSLLVLESESNGQSQSANAFSADPSQLSKDELKTLPVSRLIERGSSDAAAKGYELPSDKGKSPIYFSEHPNGKVSLFKVQSREENAREVGAYKIAEKLLFDIVEPVTEREIGNLQGTLKNVHFDSVHEVVNHEGEHTSKYTNELTERDRTRKRLFEVLVAQADKGRFQHVVLATGRIRIIDNGGALPDGMTARPSARECQEAFLDKEGMERLASIIDSEWSDLLVGTIGSRNTQIFIARKNYMLHEWRKLGN